MKVLSLFVAALFVFASLALRADDYPEGYILRQLEKARQPVEVNLAHLKPGQLLTVEYVDRPIHIYRRTEQDLAYLAAKKSTHLADPLRNNMGQSIEAAYSSSESIVWARLLLVDQPSVETLPDRSRTKSFLVIAGWAPISGCAPVRDRKEKHVAKGILFTDPCVNASYDVAGQVLKGELSGVATGRKARYNLYIPPHWFPSRNKLVIGLRPNQEIPELEVSQDDRYRGLNATQRLITAARYNDLKMVKQALKEGANANYFRVGEGSPLDAAIIGSSMEILRFLVKHGARPTHNSLYAAEFIKRTEAVELIKRLKE